MRCGTPPIQGRRRALRRTFASSRSASSLAARIAPRCSCRLRRSSPQFRLDSCLPRTWRRHGRGVTEQEPPVSGMLPAGARQPTHGKARSPHAAMRGVPARMRTCWSIAMCSRRVRSSSITYSLFFASASASSSSTWCDSSVSDCEGGGRGHGRQARAWGSEGRAKKPYMRGGSACWPQAACTGTRTGACNYMRKVCPTWM